MDQRVALDSADTHTDSIPRQPNRVLGDIPPLQRIVVPVTVIIQPRLLIVLLPWQTVWLIQVIRVLFIQLVAPFIVFCTPHSIAVFADERQRQAPVVAVVKMNFSRRCVFRLHLSGQLLHRQPALRKPHPAFTAHAVCPDFFLQSVQQPHQFSRKYHAVPVLAPSCCSFSARLRRCAFSRSPLSVSMRMSGAKLPG